MRLYILRYFPVDGELRLLRRKDLNIEFYVLSRKRANGGERQVELRPYQRSLFDSVIGSEDRMNVIYLGTISNHIFCTPRCYVTKSWEVGVCNTYQVKYLCGGTSPTSFDIHILMVMEGLQVFLQQMEIREQSVGYFYLPENLCGWIGVPRGYDDLPAACSDIWELILSIHKRLINDDTGMSVTAMLAHLNLTRRSYFNGLHLETQQGAKAPRKIFLKLLGYLYGRLIYRIKKNQLVLRQYYGHCPFHSTVIYNILRCVLMAFLG